MVRFFAPYQLNPFDLNPLRDILAAQIDFDRLRTECRLDLFIATTRVSTGTLRLFRTRELSLDVLLASACLPAVHKTVMIDGEGYWDGGLTANPPLYPLLHECDVRDIIAVLLHPCQWPEAPATAVEISQRLTEISFGAAFFSELQGIALAQREARRSLLAWGRLERRLRRLNLHVIDAPELMGTLDTVSKLNAQASFLTALRDAGRQWADGMAGQERRFARRQVDLRSIAPARLTPFLAHPDAHLRAPGSSRVGKRLSAGVAWLAVNVSIVADRCMNSNGDITGWVLSSPR